MSIRVTQRSNGISLFHITTLCSYEQLYLTSDQMRGPLANISSYSMLILMVTLSAEERELSRHHKVESDFLGSAPLRCPAPRHERWTQDCRKCVPTRCMWRCFLLQTLRSVLTLYEHVLLRIEFFAFHAGGLSFFVARPYAEKRSAAKYQY